MNPNNTRSKSRPVLAEPVICEPSICETSIGDPGKLDFNERSDGAPIWLETALRDFDARTLWRYPDRQPVETLIASYWQCNADNVLLCNGGDEAIDLVLRYAAQQKLTLVLPAPAFAMYTVTAARNALPVRTIAADSELMIAQADLLQAIAPAQLIVLTSPNNPTGEWLSAEVIEQVCRRAQSKGAMVLLDQAYADFATEQQAELNELNRLLLRYDNVLLLRSLSKSFGMAGLRCGYLLGGSKIIAAIKNLCPPFNVSSPALALISAAFTATALADMRNYTRQIANNREQLRTALLSLGVATAPSNANFLLLPLGARRADFVAAALAQSGIRVRQFFSDDSTSDYAKYLRGCLRISIPLAIAPLLLQLERCLDPDLLALDMDGVLIDTRASYDQSIIDTCATVGVQITQTAIAAQRNQGGSNDDWRLCQLLLEAQGVELSYDEIKKRFQIIYRGDDNDENGLRALESTLVNAQCAKILRQRRTAIVTGRPALEAIEGCRLLPFTPDAVISRDDVEAIKPAPEGLIKAQQLAKAKTVWLLGDSVDDMRAAVVAGALAIGVCAPNDNTELKANDAQALRAAGAVFVLDSINDITALLSADGVLALENIQREVQETFSL